MKKTVFALLAAMPMMSWAQDQFTLVTKVGKENAPSQVYLLYLKNKTVTIDSVLLVNGEAHFSDTLQMPVLARVIIDHKGEGLQKQTTRSDIRMIALDKGTITLTTPDSLKHAKVSGALNAEYDRYNLYISGPVEEIRKINLEYQDLSAADRKARQEEFTNRAKKPADEQMALEEKYLKEYPDSYFSLIALRDVAGSIIDPEKAEPLFRSLSARVRDMPDGKRYEEMIEAAKSISVGRMAPEFTQNDVNEKPVSLRDFRGKYVLVDFWASWCGPCRAENPNVRKVYDMYKDKNFTVVGISLDRPGKKDAWLGAIKADSLPWTQLSDLRYWDNEVAQKYGIKSIPQNVLVDPNGKIIAQNLRGQDLEKKLKDLFKS